MGTVLSTTLSVGLISAPVSLKTAKDQKDVSFSLASPAGEPVKQVYVVEETGEVVGTRAECARGIFDGDTFHAIDTDTISAIDDSVKIEGITVEGFVSHNEIPWERGEATYFIAPASKAGSAGTAALRLLRDGLTNTATVGIGKLTIRSRQRAFVLHVQDGALYVTTIAFADTFVEGAQAAQAALGNEPTNEGHLALFATLVDNLSVSVEQLDSYTDEALAAKAKLVEDALAGKAIIAPLKAAPKAPEADLEAALAASIAGAPKAKKAAAAKKAA